MSNKLLIADWLVHGGHQYEFFKTGHRFLCTNPNGSIPNPKSLGRPINKNVLYTSQLEVSKSSPDLIMVRSPVKQDRYRIIRGRSSPPGVAVMQTTTPFKPPRWVRCIVWNSKYSMDKYRSQFGWAKNFYIPHGFDPLEFKDMDLVRNGKMLAAANLYKKRSAFLGYSEWRWVADRMPGLNGLLGHGNDEPESIGNHSLCDLVRFYNTYSVFLNTTTNSAMPRTRAEAMMCGTPIVTTNNFGIDRYLNNGINCIIADKKEDMLREVRRVLESKSMQEDLSKMARETAVRHFNIKDYLSRWSEVFYEALL